MPIYNCTIKLVGNESVQNLEKEIISRFKADGVDDENTIARILYGIEKADPKSIMEKIGCDWLTLDVENEKVNLTTGEQLPIHLLEHIAIHASKLDPKVIVSIDFEDEDFEIWGNTSIAMKRGAPKESSVQLDLINRLIVDEKDFNKALRLNQEESTYEDVLTRKMFEDLKEQLRQMCIKALDN